VFFVILAVYSPFEVQAGFLSSVFGDVAYAKGADKAISIQPIDNSQTMTLLRPSISSSSINQGKDLDQEQIADNDTTVNIVSDSAILPGVRPMGLSTGSVGSGDVSFEDISVYVVRSGDSISQIAEMFGVSVDTILSVNDLKKGDKLKEGDVLLILPFSGVEHKVEKGQTLQGIANTYKVSIDEILSANDIEIDYKLVIGEKLMIPGADMLNESKPKSVNVSIKNKEKVSSSVQSVAGYFKNPVPGGIKSRGATSTHFGVDIAAKTGTPIHASASGRVLVAKMGWNGAYGNMVILQHANGTRTLYAHMSKLGTTTGAQVSQGDVIGYVGSTGRSTGPHLHFEVLGGKNPF